MILPELDIGHVTNICWTSSISLEKLGAKIQRKERALYDVSKIYGSGT